MARSRPRATIALPGSRINTSPPFSYPRATPPPRRSTFCDTVPTPRDKTPAAFPGMAISGGAGNRFSLFVGPKDIDLLRRINPKLEQLVDFGMARLSGQAAVSDYQLVQ